MCRMAPVMTTMSGVWSLKMEPRMKCWKRCVIASDWCTISRNVCCPRQSRAYPAGNLFDPFHFCLHCTIDFTNSFILFLPIYRGYNKQEVTCNPNNRANSAFWSIEDNIYPRCEPFIPSEIPL